MFFPSVNITLKIKSFIISTLQDLVIYPSMFTPFSIFSLKFERNFSFVFTIYSFS